MRTIKAALVAVLALCVLGPQHIRAQSLPISLFERYLEGFRQQAGIPGLSAAIVQDGRLVWDRGFGYRDVAAFASATADTPYPILDLSQTLSSTVLLQQCLELRNLELTDRVRRWVAQYPDDGTTVAHLLSHASAGGGYRYDTTRFAGLTGVIAQCASERYPRLLAAEILDRLGMTDSVPGHDLGSGSADRGLFSSGTLDRYGAVLRRVALSYHVDSRGRPNRSEYREEALSASTGVVSTVRDLARFDAALDASALLDADTRQRAWQSTGSMPTGLGWFVQRYNGERIVWHFAEDRDAYSGLYIKVPGRNLTLILLANSDGLAAPYNLSNGDITTSLFAQAFLKLFIS